MNLSSLKWKALLIIISVVLIFLSSILSFTPTVTLKSQFIPDKTLIIMKDREGNILVKISDLLSQHVESVKVIKGNNGDISSFTLKRDLRFQRNDTLGIFYSSSRQRLLTDYKNKLNELQHELQVYQSGEKKELIKQAEEQVNSLIPQLTFTENELKRKQTLFDSNLIAEEELLLSKSAYEQMVHQVNAAKQELQALKTGSKQEVIRLYQAKINSIKNNIELIHSEMQNQFLLSPFNGFSGVPGEGDTLFVMYSTERILLSSYLPLTDQFDVNVYDRVHWFNPLDKSWHEGVVGFASREIQYMGKKPFIKVIVDCMSPKAQIPSGILSEIRITLPEQTIAKWILSKFSGVVIR